MMTRPVLLAVTGNPVLHSKSPLMFNRIFAESGRDKTHTYTRLAASSAQEAIFLFKEIGLTGINITAPFKNDIMSHVDEIEPAGTVVGGINTLVVRNGRLFGYNTDIAGVADSFKKRGIHVAGKSCVVLGAGGAGRAAAYAMINAGADVILVNRTYEKAAGAAKILGGTAREIRDLQKLLNRCHILISTLSAALDIVPAHWLRKELIVFDANYKKSPLCQHAQECGCTVLRGEEWLLNQAIPAYRHFTGSRFDDAFTAPMQEALNAPPLKEIKNIALTGFMACGKTTIGKLLAAKIGFDYVDIDQLIVQHEGKSISRIFAQNGEPYFRELETEIIKNQLENNSRTIFSLGGGAVVPDVNKTILKRNALTVWLYSSIQTTLQRVRKEPGTRPLLECPDPATRARELLGERLGHYTRAADLVVANQDRPETAVEKIHDEINKTFG